eukprot:m.355708 g.355708  ORF g.355708 m.355708 type:complete len:177 (-) comp55943_c0_seq32:60-590(-)
MRKLCPREVVSFDILLLRTFPPSGVFPSALTEEFDRRFTAAACSWHLRADGSAHIEASVLGLKQGFSLKRSGNDLSRGRTTVCKYRMFERFMEVAPLAGLDVSELASASYLQAKQSSAAYTAMKDEFYRHVRDWVGNPEGCDSFFLQQNPPPREDACTKPSKDLGSDAILDRDQPP